jgi:hypothetical protein
MRVTKCGKNKSPEQKAIDAVVQENGHQIVDNNTKKYKPSIGRCHTYQHAIKNYEVEKNMVELMKMAQEFIDWVKNEKTPTYYQTFWSVHGITTESVDKICAAEPEFKKLVTYGKQLIGELWGESIRRDMQTLRSRASIYLKEFKDHEEHMIEVRERIKKQLDKEDALTPQQQQALFMSFMAPYLNKDTNDKKPENGK